MVQTLGAPGAAASRRLVWPIKEVAPQLGIGLTKVYQEVNTGRLRTIRVGGRHLVTEADLLEYIEERRRETTEA